MEKNLIELKRQKIDNLKQIYELTLKQQESLLVEDIEGLQKLINEKQMFMDKIDRIDRELEQFENKHQEEEEFDFKKIVKAIMDVDKSNRKAAQEIFHSIKIKVGQVRQGKKVHNAYNPSLANSVFFDKAR
jgi:flagellar biosynthesis/type III secretory pathway chaperone